MKILLMAMPDHADHLHYATKIPNLALVSLAGNLPGHEVKIIDLVLQRSCISAYIAKIIDDFKPDVVGLSAMTFQFETLCKVAVFIRTLDPGIRIVAGGYHVSSAGKDITQSGQLGFIDFFVRGEGEITFRELIEELEKPHHNFCTIRGLSYRENRDWIHNPDRPLADLSRIQLPNRKARLGNRFHFLGIPFDVAETSRGCPFTCTFCSITNMYGNTFRTYAIDRIIADLTDIQHRGGRGVFFADDNITYDIDHFKNICRAIVRHRLNDLTYLTQVSAAGIVKDPELATEMEEANFKFVFVGYESMTDANLKGVSKPTSARINRRAAQLLRRHGIAVIAGCIVGYPDDDEKSVIRQYRSIKSLRPDSMYAQFLTPYPGTRIRQELLESNLIINVNDFSTYNGFACNIRTKKISRDTLYKTLKKEAVKAFLDFSLFFGNMFLKRYFWNTMNICFQTIKDNIYNVLTGKQRSNQYSFPPAPAPSEEITSDFDVNDDVYIEGTE